MALTLSNVHPQLPKIAFGNASARLVRVAWDSSYATGGESLLPGDVGLTEIFYVSATERPPTGATTAHLVLYNHVDQKLQAFESGTDTNPLKEVQAADDLSTFLVDLLIIGV